MASNEVVFELLKATAEHPYEYFIYDQIGPDKEQIERLLAVLQGYQSTLVNGASEEAINTPNEEKMRILKKAFDAVYFL